MKWLEFLEDDSGRLSSTRLTVIVGNIVMSAVIMLDAWNGNTNETVIGIYAAFCGGIYAAMKGFDSSVTKASINSTTATNDVAIKAEGDVTISN